MATTIPTLADFEKLAIKSTGLVPMTHTKNLIDVKRGEIRGYAPDMALRMFNAGQAVPHKKGAELPESDGVGDLAQRDARDTIDNGTNGVTAGGAAASVRAGNVPTTGVGLGGTDTEIPADWREQSALVRTRIAKRISGKTESMSGAEADTIIEAEVQRRAAAGSNNTSLGGQGADTTAGAGGEQDA